MNKFERFLYKIGIYNIGYANKMLTPGLRILEPFSMVIDGILGIILLPTSCVPNLHQKLLHRMVKQQCRKRIADIDRKKTNNIN